MQTLYKNRPGNTSYRKEVLGFCGPPCTSVCVYYWLTVSGGDAGEDAGAVTESQTAAAAAAAAIGSGSHLTHAVSPALGYYLLPGYQSPYSSGVNVDFCSYP